jgi:DNA-directed RNA polymerase specialized sigma24 family protein
MATLHPTDQLIKQAAAGDEASFEALVAPHLELAFRLAVTLFGDAAAAEDAVQEATFKTWRHLGRLRAGSTVRAWLLTVVANECRSQRRSRWWRVLRGLERREPSERVDPDPAGWDLERALTSLNSEDDRPPAPSRARLQSPPARRRPPRRPPPAGSGSRRPVAGPR